MPAHKPLRTSDLAGVVYSSGKVFDGLRTGRLATESFLRNGETRGIASKADLALLEDLRDAAAFVIAFRDSDDLSPVNGRLVRDINRTLTRSAALRPGELRRDDQHIGVDTRYGEHLPAAMTAPQLDALVAASVSGRGVQDAALELFVQLAKAQPFEDGNKRTALFTANALLLREDTQTVLQVPVSEHDPDVAGRFNDLLARAYVFEETEPVKEYMREHGIIELRSPVLQAQPESARMTALKAQISRRAAEIEAEGSPVDEPERD